MIRIVGNLRYPNSPGSPALVAPILRSLRGLPGHEFWPDRVSLLDSQPADASLILTPPQVTDSYLLALAVSQGGRLATFDRRLSASAVSGGKRALRLIS